MEKILIIDDDTSFVELLNASLQNGGFSVFKGYNGQMALKLARDHAPELIIMDVEMPVMDGMEGLKLLRKDQATNDIPVIFVTGVSSEVIAPVIRSSSRVAYLKKPVDLQELHLKIRDFLNRYPRLAHN